MPSERGHGDVGEQPVADDRDVCAGQGRAGPAVARAMWIARLADHRLGAGARAGLDRGQHRGAVGQPAVGRRAVRIGVGRHDRGAVLAHRLEGGVQLFVVEGAVEGDDHDLRLPPGRR